MGSSTGSNPPATLNPEDKPQPETQQAPNSKREDQSKNKLKDATCRCSNSTLVAEFISTKSSSKRDHAIPTSL